MEKNETCTYTNFNGKNRALAPLLVEIVQELREYWPLTVRQIYYQAVSRLLVKNSNNEYRRISRILTTMRRADALPWNCIEDRTRRTTDKRGVSDAAEWIRNQFDTFLNWRYYHRCLIQDQEVYCEVAIEKDALSSIVEEVVWPYCTRLNVVRGQVSATKVNDIAERFDRAIMKGQVPVILYLGDLDPSGIAIPKTLKRNLLEHHSIDVDVRRIALNPGQVKDYDLPVSVDAAKPKDPNYRAWLSEYGDQAPTELDALHPKDLSQIVEAGLRDVYDLSEMDQQQQREVEDRRQIKGMRGDLMAYAAERYPEYF